MAVLAACRPAPVVTVEDLAGRSVTPLAPAPAVSAFVFVSVDCPISNRYAPALVRMRDAYARRGITLRFVYPSTRTTAAEARAHALDFGLGDAVLRDPRHALLRAAEATTTPEAVVFRGARRVYHGRIDDWFAAIGVMRAAPTTRDLGDALDAALAGRDPAVSVTEPVGCLVEAP